MHTIKIRFSPKDFDVCIGEIDIHGPTGYWGYQNINEAKCTADRLREIGCVIEASWEVTEA